MKYIIVLFFVFFSCCKDTSNKKNNHSVESNDLLSGRKDSLTMRVCDFFEESSEGGKIKAYYSRNGELLRIEVELLGELGRVYKLFRNDRDPESFTFEQRYLFYDKPIYEQGSSVIDSVLIKGRVSHGTIIKSVNGGRMSNESIERVTSNIYLSRKKYVAFIEDCTSRAQ